MGTVRAAAVAAESREIDQSQSRAIAARTANENKPRSALEAMAARLQVSTRSLQSTLMNTAFKGCSEAEFVALVIVANAFDLNPMLREIYAFPKKGGGIQAIVGYDGWIKIADRHPEFDGYEAIHIQDEKGAIEAIEGVCYRKDRQHPTKKMVYLKEFKRNTDPWNNSPNHMLDVRCFCQTIRLGMGVSGLGVEGIDDVDGGEIRGEPTPALPSNKSLGDQIGDSIQALDKETVDEEIGEIIGRDSRGFTEVDEETGRQLDAGEGGDAPEAGADEARQDSAQPQDEPDDASPAAIFLVKIKGQIGAAKNASYLKSTETEWLKHRVSYDDDTAAEVDGLIAAKRRALSAEAE